MTEQPTPETDAAILASEGQWSFALKETCQRLERERDEARDITERLIDQGLDLMDEIRHIKRERNKARKQIAAERELSNRLAEITEEGLEGMDEDDYPFIEKARKALQAWKRARNE